MNKTVIFIAFVCLALTGLVGCMLILLLRPDASATFITFVLNILGLATVAATTFYGLGKVTDKVEVVQNQTNGTLSELRRENQEKDQKIIALSRDKAALKAALKHPSRRVSDLTRGQQ